MRLPRPVTWVVRFTDGRSYTIRFDGQRWSRQRGEGAGDVTLETVPEDWVAFLTSSPEERRRRLAETHIEGKPERIDEFARTLGRPESAAPASAEAASTSQNSRVG